MGRNNFCSGRKVEVVSLFQNIGSGHRRELSSTVPISGKISLYQYAKRGHIQMVLFIPVRCSISRIFSRKGREIITESTMEAFTLFLNSPL